MLNAVRTCTKCGQVLPETPEYFHRQGSGLRPNCKRCELERKRKAYNSELQRVQKADYRKANPEKARESNRKNYNKHAEQRRLYAKEYRLEHHETVTEKERVYRTEHQLELKKRRREIYAKEPERFSAYFNRRRARKKSLPDTFDHEQALNALNYWNRKCAYCGKRLTATFCMDHFIPLSDPRPDNPGTVASNMLPACSRCNTSKNRIDPFAWILSRFPKKAKRIIKAIESYFAGLK